MEPRRAREILESLIREEDPFHLVKAQGALLPGLIVAEAWTLDKKKDIEQHAASLGYRLVDHLIAGDYDLALWHTRRFQENPNTYVVSINNAQHDPLSPEAQTSVQKYKSSLPYDTVCAKLAEWVDRHGSVLVGSFVPKRNTAYLRMVRQMMPGYTVAPYFQNSYDYGFRLSRGGTASDH